MEDKLLIVCRTWRDMEDIAQHGTIHIYLKYCWRGRPHGSKTSNVRLQGHVGRAAHLQRVENT